MTRVLIVEDHVETSLGLEQALHPVSGLDVMAPAERLADIPVDVPMPDVVVLDLRLPDVCRRDVVPRVSALLPESKILVRTAYDNPVDLLIVVAQGARGYVAKGGSIDELVRAIERVAHGGVHIEPRLAGHLKRYGSGLRFTERELEMLKLIGSRGLTDAELAGAMYVSKKTIRGYKDSICTKASGLVAPNSPRAFAGLASAAHSGCSYCDSEVSASSR